MPPIDRRVAIALLVAATTFMEIMDATVITTSLPIIANDFGVAASHLSIGVSAYLVAVTIFVPLSGWITDRIGPRNVFAGAICLFSFASVLCALSDSLITFTLARIVQGVGGAMMVPVGRLVVLRSTSKAQLVNAIALLTWPALTAPLIGPILGGWIAMNWGWQWVFLINLPFGAVALIATFLLIDNEKRQTGKFDLVGFSLCGIGFGLFMAGLELLSSAGQIALIPSLLVLAGFGVLGTAIFHLHRSDTPLFTFYALQYHTFRLSVLSGSLARIAIGSAPFLLPLMFQLTFGYTAVEAGSLLLWLFAGNLAMKTITTWLMNTFGFKRVLLVNVVMISAGFALIGTVSTTTPYWLISLLLFVSGMNRSMHFTALNSIAFSDVPEEKMRDANTLSGIINQMNRGLGIAVGALLLAIATWLCGNSAASHELIDFQLTFYFTAGLALLSLLDIARLHPDAGGAVLK